MVLCIQLRLFVVKPTKSLPGITMMKDFVVYLTMDPAMHGAVLEISSPCELWGFNIGDLVEVKVADVSSNSDMPKAQFAIIVC
jgi:hypothetical protein